LSAPTNLLHHRLVPLPCLERVDFKYLFVRSNTITNAVVTTHEHTHTHNQKAEAMRSQHGGELKERGKLRSADRLRLQRWRQLAEPPNRVGLQRDRDKLPGEAGTTQRRNSRRASRWMTRGRLDRPPRHEGKGARIELGGGRQRDPAMAVRVLELPCRAPSIFLRPSQQR
jgi:hypothetical protein